MGPRQFKTGLRSGRLHGLDYFIFGPWSRGDLTPGFSTTLTRQHSTLSIRRLGTYICACLLLCASGGLCHAQQPGGSGSNLLHNGDFELGNGTPEGWQTIDGLTSFWADDEDKARGKALKVDTDVLQKQAYAWWSEIKAGAPPSKAPAKLPTTPPKYDTLAGLDGVWFYSHPVPVETGKTYWLTLDVKGPEIMVWLLGYTNRPDITFGADAGAFQGYLQEKAGTRDTGRNHKMFIDAYDWKGQLKAGGANVWKTYSRRSKPFNPTQHTPNVRYVRVLLLPYWPPGEYWIDNVRLTEVGPSTH